MVSAFQSKETGVGTEISEEDLERINAKRKNTDYFDKVAAKDVINTTKRNSIYRVYFRAFV